MTSTYPKRVIRAALFDAISAAAAAIGGIGNGSMYEHNCSSLSGVPLCFFGLLHSMGFFTAAQLEAGRKEKSVQLEREVGLGDANILFSSTIGRIVREAFGIEGWSSSDHAVSVIRQERLLGFEQRVPFDKWAEYFNLQRAVELPAAVYDALKKSADLFGIGANYLRQYNADATQSTPLCILGHAYNGDNDGDVNAAALKAAFQAEWLEVGWTNDRAVRAINNRKGTPELARVTFEEWAEELNVIRVIELSAENYDALKASADQFGGIGAGWFYENGTPLCARGHCWAVQRNVLYGSNEVGPVDAELEHALSGGRSGIGIAGPSDRAVQAINERKGEYHNARVTFEEWANELKIVRGAK
jgi:hypothetical protein